MNHLAYRQKTRFARAVILLSGVLAMLAACSGSSKVRTDYDRSINFSQYHTFRIMGHEGHGGLRENYSSLTDQRINEAIRQQMLLKGFVPAAEPDLLINYTVTVENKQSVTTTTVPRAYVGFGYGYGYHRAGFYAPWPNYATQTQIREYKQGTLVIDVVDRRRRMMIWEGLSQGTVTDKKLSNLEETINSAVARIMAGFPPGRATSSNK